MRLPAVILACALAASPAWAACIPPALDSASLVNANSIPPVITTSGPNELILYYSSLLGGQVSGGVAPLPPVVTSVSDGAGLTWHQRGSVVTYAQSPPTCGGARCAINLQLWWAYSTGQLTNDTITPVYSFPPPSNFWSVVFGVSNVLNQAAPFDTNVSVPAVNSANLDGATYNIAFSTTQPSDLLLVTCGSIAITAPLCDVLQSKRPPWNLFASWNVLNLGGAAFFTLTTLANVAAGAQSITSGEPNWLGTGDAILGCAPVAGVQFPFVWINE